MSHLCTPKLTTVFHRALCSAQFYSQYTVCASIRKHYQEGLSPVDSLKCSSSTMSVSRSFIDRVASRVTLRACCWHNRHICVLPWSHHCLRLLKSPFLCLKTPQKYVKTYLKFLSNVKTELKCQYALFGKTFLTKTWDKSREWSVKPAGRGACRKKLWGTHRGVSTAACTDRGSGVCLVASHLCGGCWQAEDGWVSSLFGFFGRVWNKLSCLKLRFISESRLLFLSELSHSFMCL